MQNRNSDSEVPHHKMFGVPIKKPEAAYFCLTLLSSFFGSSVDALDNLQDIWNKGNPAYASDNYAEAVKFYSQVADHSIAEAEFVLRVFHAKGQGVSQDYTEAARCLRKAVD